MTEPSSQRPDQWNAPGELEPTSTSLDPTGQQYPAEQQYTTPIEYSQTTPYPALPQQDAAGQQAWSGFQQPAPAQGYPYPPLQPMAPMGVPAPYGYEPSTGLPYSEKSKVTAGLLQIFLGGFGVGRFYKGDIGIAILQIVVTFCTLGIGGLWPFIDGIVMLAGRPLDKQGRPLRG